MHTILRSPDKRPSASATAAPEENVSGDEWTAGHLSKERAACRFAESDDDMWN
jgi:hypothetical protein